MSGFDINSTVISGNLTAAPELRNLPGSGTAVCSFRIAHNERYKDTSASGRTAPATSTSQSGAAWASGWHATCRRARRS